MMSVWPAAADYVYFGGVSVLYEWHSVSSNLYYSNSFVIRNCRTSCCGYVFTDDIAKISTVMGEIDGILNQPELVRPKERVIYKILIYLWKMCILHMMKKRF